VAILWKLIQFLFFVACVFCTVLYVLIINHLSVLTAYVKFIPSCLLLGYIYIYVVYM
jgi:hypothetical protein